MDAFKQDLLSHGYILGEEIGKGGFSTVYLVYSQKYNQEFVAKRVLHPTAEHLSEIGMLMNLYHNNIIKIYEYFQSGEFSVIILEHCENGCLASLIESEGPLEVPTLYNVAHQIALAIQFCHDSGICHSDIKPANILMDKYGRPKLIDFGLSQKMRNDDSKRLSKMFGGSIAYMAPELLKKAEHDPYPCDIWALGVTFFVLCYKILPWPSDDKSEVITMISSGTVCFPSMQNKKFSLLIRKMLVHDPKKRPKIHEVVKMIEAMYNVPCALGEKLSKKKVYSSQTKFMTSSKELKCIFSSDDEAMPEANMMSSPNMNKAALSYLSGSKLLNMKAARRRSLVPVKTFV